MTRFKKCLQKESIVLLLQGQLKLVFVVEIVVLYSINSYIHVYFEIF